MKKEELKSIDQISKEYNEEVLRGATLLHELMKDFIGHELNKEELDGVIEAEKNCDRIKDRYIQVLFQDKRALPFLVEDRYKIITLVDEALGKTEFLARFLQIFPFDLYDDISEDFGRMCDICLTVMQMLIETLHLMETNFDEAYEGTFEIESIRREARTIRFNLLEIVYKKTDNPTRVYLTSLLINNLYEIISFIEDIADYLRGLIIKYPAR
jgi:predicted phosphate transport protein (TIGR00153 family)